MINYFNLIHKYIDPASITYPVYITHVCLVTAKALKAAHKLGLSEGQQRFIEEAAMLHDIGIIRVRFEAIGCRGELPYICHGVTGRQMLEAEGLPAHALVAERHTGVGITAAEISKTGLPLPRRDMLAGSLEEQIISWADLYYGKSPGRTWLERSPQAIKQDLSHYDDAEEKIARFAAWTAQFDG